MRKVELISESASVSMGEAWFDIVNSDHFWIQWRLNALKKILRFFPKKGMALEVGCGNGLVMEQIEQLGYITDGCDLNRVALETISEDVKGKVMLYNIYDRSKDLLGKYSMVFLMDVIEHIEDDVDFLKTSAEYLQSDGIVIVNVPAYNSLFSKYDKEVGHVRRYTKRQLAETLNKAGIEPLVVSYWGAFLFPIAVVRKMTIGFTPSSGIIKRGMTPPGKLAHLFLKALMKMESILPFAVPFGTSVIAIGKMKK
ncbi:MAG: methyltransferase domain-containing protein [Bacteroidota bacterium]